MNNRYEFKFGGQALSELHGVVTSHPPREVAQYDFKLLDIPGMDGSEYIDNKRFKNVVMKRDIGFPQNSFNRIDDIVEKAINWLAYKLGYQEFEDSDHPGMITYAVLTNFTEVQQVLRRYHTATLKFSRLPFWYEKGGLNEISMTGGEAHTTQWLHNNHPIVSKPQIQLQLKTSVTTSSSFSIRYYDRNTDYETFTYDLANLPIRTSNNSLRKYVFFDFERGEVLLSTAESGGDIAYANAEMPEGFGPGKNGFCLFTGYSNTVDYVKITPRWRCL